MMRRQSPAPFGSNPRVRRPGLGESRAWDFPHADDEAPPLASVRVATVDDDNDTTMSMDQSTVPSLQPQERLGGTRASNDDPTLASTEVSSMSNGTATPTMPQPDRQPGLFKVAGVPKSALHAEYGKPPRRKNLVQTDYISWHNSGPPHIRMFTSVFVCPVTRECFPSGRFENYKIEVDPETGRDVVWYSKKILAEHAAAARAYDCIVARGAPAGTTPKFLGEDPPYSSKEPMPLPSNIPPEAREQIEKARKAGMEVDDPDEEFAWQRRI